MARQGNAVENLDHRAVIFPAESGVAGGGEHIQRGGRERQREGQRPGGVIHQTEIFDKNIDGGFLASNRHPGRVAYDSQTSTNYPPRGSPRRTSSPAGCRRGRRAPSLRRRRRYAPRPAADG